MTTTSDAAATWRCTECRWTGRIAQMETLPNTKHDLVYQVCPLCGAADHFMLICDEPGCELDVTCGWNSSGGYRRTCGKHFHLKVDSHDRSS